MPAAEPDHGHAGEHRRQPRRRQRFAEQPAGDAGDQGDERRMVDVAEVQVLAAGDVVELVAEPAVGVDRRRGGARSERSATEATIHVAVLRARSGSHGTLAGHDAEIRWTTDSCLLLPLFSWLAGCAERADRPRTSAQGASSMDRVAESYVKLVLAVGQHDPDYVDAYYGPPEWKVQAEAAKRPLADLRAEAERLVAELQAMPGSGETRWCGCATSISPASSSPWWRGSTCCRARRCPSTRSRRRSTTRWRRTYGADHFQGILDQLETLVPGDGPLPERIDRFRQGFVIPRDKLDAVFKAAIDECRRRTLEHIELPPGESFEVEYVTGKSWSGYNWYKGGFHSLIQVNTDLPIFIDRAIDLACHEGYPGHHVYNVAAGEAPGARPRLAGVLGLCAVQPAVADRGGHGELRHRGGVPGRRSGCASSARSSSRWPGSIPRRPSATTRSSASRSSWPTRATRRRGGYLNGDDDEASRRSTGWCATTSTRPRGPSSGSGSSISTGAT